MPFSRVVQPESFSHGDQLTADMIGIGMRFSGTGNPQANIEDTLFAASLDAMLRDDLRTVSVLVTWLFSHAPWINIARLTGLVADCRTARVRAFWAAIAAAHDNDPRMRKLKGVYRGKRVNLLRPTPRFLLKRHGEDPRLLKTSLIVPAGTLRDRQTDVLSPAALARRHPAYRWRMIIGPSYRADMWAALESAPALTPAELARITYGSFASAWRVKRDWEFLHMQAN